MICICRLKTCIGIGPTVLIGQGIGGVDRSTRSEHPGTTTLLAERDLIATLSNQLNLQQSRMHPCHPCTRMLIEHAIHSTFSWNSKSMSATKLVIPGGNRIPIPEIRWADGSMVRDRALEKYSSLPSSMSFFTCGLTPTLYRQETELSKSLFQQFDLRKQVPSDVRVVASNATQ
jgi:hypothetical protein